jgi:deoxyhypusine monooxygenase
MVRHEAAEALGGIATDDCLPVLQEFATKAGVPRVVKESCEVALDMASHVYRFLICGARADEVDRRVQYQYERSGEFVPLPVVA